MWVNQRVTQACPFLDGSCCACIQLNKELLFFLVIVTNCKRRVFLCLVTRCSSPNKWRPILKAKLLKIWCSRSFPCVCLSGCHEVMWSPPPPVASAALCLPRAERIIRSVSSSSACCRCSASGSWGVQPHQQPPQYIPLLLEGHRQESCGRDG